MRKLIVFLFFVATFTATLSAQQYDLVLQGGRVMDPETSLDAVRNVGISGGKMARISSEPLSGRRVIDARGLVVAPGFIDLHQHAQDIPSQRVKALDGVTSAPSSVPSRAARLSTTELRPATWPHARLRSTLLSPPTRSYPKVDPLLTSPPPRRRWTSSANA